MKRFGNSRRHLIVISKPPLYTSRLPLTICGMTLPSTIQQWTSDQDGLDNLKLSEVPMPKPGQGEVLLKISAVAINYRACFFLPPHERYTYIPQDTEVIMGLYNHHKNMSSSPTIVPTSDMCGSIVLLGPNATRWNLGDRVLSIFNQTHLKGQVELEDLQSGLGLPLPGTLTQYRIFPETGLVRAPTILTDEEASTLPIAGVTAWMALNWHRPLGSPLSAGETVLIQGTGGVAINGLLIAKAAGARVIIISSSDEKLERAKKLGAYHGINYKTVPDWEIEVLNVTGNKGADIIFENGGARTLRKSFECVAFGGLIACIGYLSGKETETGKSPHTSMFLRFDYQIIKS